MQDKRHWYDGKIYETFIAPHQDDLYKLIKNIIPPNSKVLDVGCGTGRMDFLLAQESAKVIGIDLSSKNIKTAKEKLQKKNLDNIEFIHGSILDIKKFTDEPFDIAIITYVLHEMDPEERIRTLRLLKTAAQMIIIADYIVPVPKDLSGLSAKTIEFLAGKNHFTNYRNFVKNGGLQTLAADAGLQIKETLKAHTETRQIIVIE
ncbi:cypemycin methyltransferase [bacterium BMS3Abin04]|nr:cypemycin methyltransferase [bacterium BMS3Abin04]